MFSEKDFKNIINEHEITSFQKNQFNEVIKAISQAISNLKYFKSLDIVDSLSNVMISSDNEINMTVIFNEVNKNQLIMNDLELAILCYVSDTELLNRDYYLNAVKIKYQDLYINVFVRYNDEKLQNFNYNNDLKRLEMINEYQKKYTYFINTVKFLKVMKEGLKLEYLNDYLITVILMYGLDKHYKENRYSDYLNAFIKALDDFINGGVIDVHNSFDVLIKGRKILDLVNGEIISNQINDVNIGELRNYRKKIAKLLENKNQEILGSAKIVLDVKPVVNNDKLSWSYILKDTDYKASGGDLINDEYNYKNAILRGIFKGLKFIVEKENIYTKNIVIINATPNILLCIEKNAYEAENNSRRKTIVRFIEENKLNVSFM